MDGSEARQTETDEIITPLGDAGSDSMLRRRGTRPRRGDMAERIVESTLTTIRTLGMNGASARAIARTGSFNQALIFYYFDSLDALYAVAAMTNGERRLAATTQRLAPANDGAAIGRALAAIVDEGTSNGDLGVYGQLVAAAARIDALNEALQEIDLRWHEILRATLARVGIRTERHDDFVAALDLVLLGCALQAARQPFGTAKPPEGLSTTLDALLAA